MKYHSNKYVLDEAGNPVETEDLMAWARWFESSERVVKQERIGESKVSTVFLGIDHNYSGVGEPILWETMVFGGKMDNNQDRCTGLKSDALLMHERMVERVKKVAE